MPLAAAASPWSWDDRSGTALSTCERIADCIERSATSTGNVNKSTTASSPANEMSSGSKATEAQRPPRSVEGLRSTIQTTTTNIGGTFHIEADDRVPSKSRGSSRNIIHKTRVFGQSHWVNGVSQVLQIPPALEVHLREDALGVASKLQRCKALARIIKSHRTPSWPTSPTADLPPKEVADELVDCYLRTMERVYRVVHIPSFKRDYEALWTSSETPSMTFIVQLKLILAIGAPIYDEAFSLRESATRWVYEAQTWLSEPGLKSQLSIKALQISVLLLLARESTGVGETLVWTAAGSLLRTAMYMGLHRDPARLPPGGGGGSASRLLDAEMRRRLWNTILELELQSSMASGGPPLLSLLDFDTRPPGNWDDEQLEQPIEAADGGGGGGGHDDEAVLQPPRPDDQLTQTSVAIALRKTFAARLAVLKFLNDASSSGTYTEALRLDGELRGVYRDLHETLRGYGAHGESSSKWQFERRFVDILLLRYLSALHAPFFGPSLHEPEFAYSRRVVTDSSLKIWSAAAGEEGHAAAGTGGGCDMARLATNGSGLLRMTIFQAGTLAALELRAQLADDAPGPTLVRTDLLGALRGCQAWSLRCIASGVTNVKGCLVLSLLAAQVEGLLAKRPSVAPPEADGGEADGEQSQRAAMMRLVEAAVEVEDECLVLLEDAAGAAQAARREADGSTCAHDAPSATPSLDLMSEWDSLMTDDPLLGSTTGFQFSWSL
ncbi:C6 transcription factor [Purpureocillium lavendulum]|uniref:C6 transcription factor n=1 Tax=Purpureocillium lavendulum TaxID=1247861 RepID=A0AB34FX00_9HYPO|nr:C6 transcription factor [Purpureocillium lavendulum]